MSAPWLVWLLAFASISCATSRAAPDSAVPFASAPSPAAASSGLMSTSLPTTSDREPVARFGAKFRYASDILKEERDYWVDLPDKYEESPSAKAAYPVLYLLDAERFFAQAAATVKFMSELGTIPEMIVVGIPSTDHRTRDMTPTHSLKGPNGETTQRGAKSGGADVFLSSLQKELIPRIEARYRTIPYRTVVGHSLTGLFALHAFLQDPASFQAIIAMDPSLWWDDQLLVKRAASRFSANESPRNVIFLATAHLDLDAPGKRPRAATEAFYRAIQFLPSPSFRAKLQSFEEESHGSVPLPAFYHGLSFAFRDYQVPMADAIKDPGYLVAHYRQFSERRGANFDPPEAAFSTVGYVLLFEQKKVDEAIALLEENARRHPTSPSAHEYLGEAFLVKDDKSAAIRCFERVLQLKPGDEEATKHLKTLRAK